MEWGACCASLGVAYAEKGRESNMREDYEQAVVHLKSALEVSLV
jgi:hypothetical protein